MVDIRESIRIKDFGPLRDAQIDNIRRLTVVIGESASGKSTLLKVVALFRYLMKMSAIRSFFKNAKISRNLFRLNFEKLLKTSDLEKMLSLETEIVYAIKIGDVSYEIAYRDKRLTIPKKIKNEHLVFFKVSFISEQRNIIPSWLARSGSLRGGRLGFYFHETLSDFEEATNVIVSIPLNFVGFDFKVTKSQGRKKFLIHKSDENIDVDLKEASSGIQSGAPLLTLLSYFSEKFSFEDAVRRSILELLYSSGKIREFTPEIELSELPHFVHLHLEEPELSLFPSAQTKLISTLSEKISSTKSSDRTLTLMVATHSPFIVNQLNVLFRKFEKDSLHGINANDVSVYRIFDGSLQDLMQTEISTGKRIVDTTDFSEVMEALVNEYQEFDK